MNIKSLRSDHIYQKVAQASPEEKLELFRNELCQFIRVCNKVEISEVSIPNLE